MNALKQGIRTYPDPVLRRQSQAVGAVGEDEAGLISYMVETMYANQGIGLAAPQVGVTKRIIVVDAGKGLLKMVNPEIISTGGLSALEEGCLSVPGKLVEIRRPERIVVSFIDEENAPFQKSFEGLAAKAVQHEIDHLNGRLIVDYLSWYGRLFPKRGKVKCLQ